MAFALRWPAMAALMLTAGPPSASSSRFVVHKCCGRDMAYDESQECSRVGPADGFKVPKRVKASGVINGEYEMDEVQIVYRKLSCSYETFKLDSNDTFSISEKGVLKIRSYVEYHSPNEFCIEKFNDGERFQMSVLVCGPYKTLNYDTLVFPMADKYGKKIIAIGMAISLPLLSVTLLAHMLLEELQNIHGLTVMCYIVIIILNYITFIVYHTVNVNRKHKLFFILEYILFFSYSGRCSWFNVMCYNFWRSYNDKFPSSDRNSKSEKKSFIKLFIYAMVLSFLCSTFNYVMVYFLSDSSIENQFFSITVMMACFHVPIEILFIIDFVLISHNVIRITIHVNRSLKFANNSMNKMRYMVYLRLFCIVFVVLIYWYSQFKPWIENSKSVLLSRFAVIGIVLNAALIFGICLCKKRVFMQLNRKLKIFPMTEKKTNSTVDKHEVTINITRSTITTAV